MAENNDSKLANQCSVQMYKNGQIITTIPRAISQALRLKKGDVIEWMFDKGDVVVRKR